MQHTFYWHDYETFGASAAHDRPAQFAGLRTDAELNETGEPLLLYCQPPRDYLPQPDACLIHGIAPQYALAHGLPEREFIARIHAEFAQPGTCGVGYNSIRFDDEFTRHALYRNFQDPYEREYQHGNSRWDLIDVMRMARCLRPEGMVWPDRADGRPSFRLEDLARANGVEHLSAHDALSDVRATLALARRLRDCQPRLFEYALKARDKHWVFGQLDLRKRQPILHISSRFPAEQGCAAVIVPLAQHPGNRNSIIACNLTLDPGPLLELDAASLRARMYTRREQLPPGAAPVPLKEIHANKSPMLAPLAMLGPELAERYGIDLVACHARLERLNAAGELPEKLREVFGAGTERAARDPELDLYGAFLPDRDRRLMGMVREADAQTLACTRWGFSDPRLPELLFRYRAHSFPDSLNADERERWREHCQDRLRGAASEGWLDCARYGARIAELRAERGADPAALALLGQLEAWGAELCA